MDDPFDEAPAQGGGDSGGGDPEPYDPFASNNSSAAGPPDPYHERDDRLDDDEDYDVHAFDPEEKQDVEPWRAVVVGATGATGCALIKALVSSEQCAQVTAVVRRVVPDDELQAKFGISEEESGKLRQDLIDFDHLDEFKEVFQGYSRGFCCLGTTRTAAGSAEAFRKVDLQFVTESAHLMHEGGVEHFSLVSAQGASARSWFLYPRTKGEAEDACRSMQWARFSIFRPCLLLTPERDADDSAGRRIEWFAQRGLGKLSWLLPDSVTPVSVVTLAEAMVLNAERYAQGPVEVFENAAICSLKVGRQLPEPPAEPRAKQARRACFTFGQKVKRAVGGSADKREKEEDGTTRAAQDGDDYDDEVLGK